MSVLGWFLKPKKEMAKKGTKKVRIWKYTISSHAQNRTVQPNRQMTKFDMVDNLLTKPNAITSVKADSQGKKSYNRVGKRVTTSINPETNVVATVRPVSSHERKKYNLQKHKNGKYYKR